MIIDILYIFFILIVYKQPESLYYSRFQRLIKNWDFIKGYYNGSIFNFKLSRRPYKTFNDILKALKCSPGAFKSNKNL